MSALKRFLISHPFPDEPEENQKVFLAPDETHHLKHVLRIKIGEECLLSDGQGQEFLSRVGRFLNDGRSEMLLLKRSCQIPQARIKLSAAQAIPQRGKMDDIVEKAAQLGIEKLIPILTERTVVKPKETQAWKMHSRWEQIARQTVKQSGAPFVPLIARPVAFEQLWSGAFDFDSTFLLHPGKQAASLKALDFNRLRDKKILLVIGPEGGFSPGEVEEARKAGTQIIRMSLPTLKTDTAFVAAVSFFQNMLGE